jgi:hypothetical protein
VKGKELGALGIFFLFLSHALFLLAFGLVVCC